MAENTPATAATKTAILDKIAVIFDSRQTDQKKSTFLTAKAQRSFSATAKFVPLPVVEEGKTPFINSGQTIELRHGANLGILTTAWTYHEKLSQDKRDSRIPDRFGDYQAAGAFSVFVPEKGKDGSLYSHYKIDDALKLIEATLSVADIEKYIEGEDREVVLQTASIQKEGIAEEINARLTAYA